VGKIEPMHKTQFAKYSEKYVLTMRMNMFPTVAIGRTMQSAVIMLGVFCFVAASGVAWAQKRPESNQGPSVAWQPQALGNPADYAGPDRCKSCHKPEFIEFSKTSHAHQALAAGKSITACEVCHGPAKAHSDAMEDAEGDDAKIAAGLKEHPLFVFKGSSKENAERCLTCHITSKQQQGFGHSSHISAGVSCVDCHATHLVVAVNKADTGAISSAQAHMFQVPRLPDEVRWLHSSLLKKSEPELCFTCHLSIKAQFALPIHHRVPEGLMKCTDCHNPHGTLNHASLAKANSETCVSCHTEKRGPYVFDHPAIKVEGCVVCHYPHGSTNRMLLARREPRQLCLQCHTAFHAQAGVPHGRLGFAPGGECVRCHVSIHGSNFDVNFLR
jgi:predicted CXXCH cytochrome family protein